MDNNVFVSDVEVAENITTPVINRTDTLIQTSYQKMTFGSDAMSVFDASDGNFQKLFNLSIKFANNLNSAGKFIVYAAKTFQAEENAKIEDIEQSFYSGGTQ